MPGRPNRFEFEFWDGSKRYGLSRYITRCDSRLEEHHFGAAIEPLGNIVPTALGDRPAQRIEVLGLASEMTGDRDIVQPEDGSPVDFVLLDALRE